MKRVFFVGVIVYSLAILILMDLPTAVSFSGTAALPWMVKCLIDLCFIGAAFFTMFGSQIQWDDDEVGIHPDDVKVPDTWLYGAFGLNLLCNFGWHGYEFATLSGAESLYNAVWFFAEFAAMFLTFILFKHAGQVARREARNARAKMDRDNSDPRPFTKSDKGDSTPFNKRTG